MKITKQARRLGMLMSGVLLSVSLLTTGGAKVQAEVVYTYQDEKTSMKLPAGKPYIQGPHMVWCEADEQGFEQVFYQNLGGGDKQQITQAPSRKEMPKVGVGPDNKLYIVWKDGRHYALNQPAKDFYAYDASAAREWKLNSATGLYAEYSMDGTDVVAFDSFTRNMVHFDLAQDKETIMGQGRSPVVASGKLLHINARDGGLTWRDLRSGETRSVLQLPHHLNVINVHFNGTYALYKQADLDWNTKYVMLHVSDPGAKPVDLTPATKKKDEYYQLYMGAGAAAWLQDTGSGAALMGANLGKSERHVIASSVDPKQVLAFQGDRLMSRTPDGFLAYKTIIRNEMLPSSGGSYSPPAPAAGKQVIGVKGGELTAGQGAVRLVIAENTVQADTEMSLALDEERTKELSALPASPLQPASKAWRVNLGGGLTKSAALSLRYEASGWSTLQTRKLVVYRWDDIAQRWEQAGAALDENNQVVTASIERSGVYALFMNNVSFIDVQKHWAQDYIEVLASRSIVSGMNHERYAPDEAITRAQFTTLLLGALGVKLSDAPGSLFTDVPSSHWSAGWIASAVARGLVEGDGDAFHPDRELTREQMIVMLARALGEENKAKALSEAQLTEGLSYTDASEISAWSRPYAALLSRYGLIEGSGGMLQPKQPSTRAQAATVMYRLLEQKNLF